MLAVHGGEPTIAQPLRPYRSITEAEIQSVIKVMQSGCLSGFYGSWGDEFYGGPKVRELEWRWAERFSCKYAVSMNSATSCLIAAMGAVGLSPGDEVIVPPYTMSATVVAPLFYGGIPVFVDIDEQDFCLDVTLVEKAITERTKVILVVNLFGHPARLCELRKIADKYGLFLIEDSAQSPLAMEVTSYCGTVGDIGVFSLNYHKHIHAGEGGVCVTDNENLAQRLQLLRNHGENVVDELGIQDITNLVGGNYRLTEIGAAIATEQLARIDFHVSARIEIGERLSEGIAGLEGLIPPFVRNECRHVYYIWALRIKQSTLGVSREDFSRALSAEGVPHFCGYVRPLYMLPIFQKRIAFGRNGYPFNCASHVSYNQGLCPVAEHMFSEALLLFEPCAYNLDANELERIISAFHKVHARRNECRSC